jgi:hypothetical protein
VLYEALSAAEARGAGDNPQTGRHSHRLLTTTAYLQREHAAERRHLPRGDRMRGM